MADKQTFGQLIAAARKKKGLSQKELAGKIKKDDGSPITPQYLNDIEHDRRNPGSSQLIGEFSRVLGIEKYMLFFLAGQVPDDIRNRSVDLHKVPEAFAVFRRTLTDKDNKRG
ncbi:MAG: helix-turn-helix transcriptional regulator [Acidobacteriota bacterium]|nr:helix-turn-helix transcriptional regulator [Acidobacteriota bacterium]